MSGLAQLTQLAAQYKASGRMDQAIAVYAEIVRLAPASAVAEHNLAAALGDAGRHHECETHVGRAFQLGGNAGETWLVLGRALMGLKRFEDARRAFHGAIARKHTLYDAHRDLAQLNWMTTGDAASALADIEAALRVFPQDAHLAGVRAQVLETLGEVEAAGRVLANLALTHPDHAPFLVRAAQSAQVLGDFSAAMKFAERAAAVSRGAPAARAALAEACLGNGDATRAAAIASSSFASEPYNQHLIAVLATAYRMLGDCRYRELYDYDALVGVASIECPPGWRDINDYLVDLEAALVGEHAFLAHPINQSIRFGTQATDILQRDSPALRALPDALHGPIERFLAAVGQGSDPVRRRNSGRYRFAGMWSVRMSAGGHHINHVHSMGWISSACYVALPRKGMDREGWIKFGEPGIRTTPALDAEYFVEPTPARLVLFPSYMWHGTVPFSDPGMRLTFAFDLLPE